MKKQILEDFIKRYSDESDIHKRVMMAWEFSEIYFDTFRFDLEPVLLKELENCRKEKYFDGEAVLSVMLSQICFDNQKVQEAINYIRFVENNISRIESDIIRGYGHMFVGIMYIYQGDYAKAFDQSMLAKNAYSGKTDFKQYGWVDYGLAAIYLDLKDTKNAIAKFKEARASFEKFDYAYAIARCDTGIGTALILEGKIDEAEELFLKSLKIYESLEMYAGMSRVYNELGVIYRKKGDLKKASEFLEKALKLRRDISHSQGIATTLNEIAEICFEQKKYDEAIELLKENIALCKSIGNKLKLYRAHLLIYKCYKIRNNSAEALHHFEEYDRIKSEVTSAAATNKLRELEKKAATEKAEKEAEIERLRNVELKNAFDMIEEKNREILDSINYAKRIQYTLLASDEVLKTYLPEHFVLFKPKDIVSGDFYWFTHSEDGNTFYLAVCDSTGHGVPGAFMSLLNITFLNEAINEKHITEPGKILDYVREQLVKKISQDGAKDGMDATLIKFERAGNSTSITYAAAYNYPILVRKGECIDQLFDKMPVGKDEAMLAFNTYKLETQAGDMLYLATDGYADQFGGEAFGVSKPGGKKLKKSNLKKLLLEIAPTGLSDQKSKLLKSFEDWKGKMEQVDDVILLGIKL